MIKRPPQHSVDAAIVYISSGDDAWDHDRIASERAAMRAEGERGPHAVDVYYSGSTRYDLDAPHTVGGQVVTPRQYLRADGVPTLFRLRRVEAMRREQALAVWGSDRERVAALYDLARHGVVAVTEGTSGPAWDLEGGAGGRPLTQADLQLLYDARHELPTLLGLAVLHASAPLSEVEGKR